MKRTVTGSMTLAVSLMVAAFNLPDTASARGWQHGESLPPGLERLQDRFDKLKKDMKHRHAGIQVGPRPDWLVDDMDDGPLKDRLQQCENKPMGRTDFSIGHRGAPLQFPEHTMESYVAAAKMGAGIVECDVAFTADRELVCRHAQNDLHTTTNIVTIPELNAKCTQPLCRRIQPAAHRPRPNVVPATSPLKSSSPRRQDGRIRPHGDHAGRIRRRHR